MAKYVVGRVKDAPPGTQREIRIGDLSIGLFNVDGSYRALLNRCPHRGAPLVRGTLVGQLESTCPGEYTYNPAKSFVRCVWHGWEFDLTNGRSWVDPERKRVRPYPVTVEHRTPGPYAAETFPVSVEDDYIVIEIGRP